MYKLLTFSQRRVRKMTLMMIYNIQDVLKMLNNFFFKNLLTAELHASQVRRECPVS